MSRGSWIADNEILLYEHFDSSVVITDKRIRCKQSTAGDLPFYTSMMLKDVTSINLRKDGHIWALVLGLLFFILGVSAILDFRSWGLGSLMTGMALTIYYYSSREHIIEFKQINEVIKLPIKYMTCQDVMGLVEKIEQVKISQESV